METAALEISALLEEGRKRAAELEAQAQAAEAQRLAEKRVRIAEAWQPYRDVALAALPGWAQPYLKKSDQEPTIHHYGDTTYRPLPLALPGLAPIRVYVDGRTVGYSVPRADVQRDTYEDGDNSWVASYVWPDYSVTRWQIQQMTDDLAVAVYQAQAVAEQYARCQDEAEQRNREDAVRAAPPLPEPEAEEPTALALARTMLRQLETMDVAYTESAAREAMVYAQVAAAEALTRLAEVAETLLEANTVRESTAIWAAA